MPHAGPGPQDSACVVDTAQTTTPAAATPTAVAGALVPTAAGSTAAGDGPTPPKPLRIAHLADIHVKDRRRKEYARVFAALAKQLDAERPKVDAIALAGDVFDTMSFASAPNWRDVASLLEALSAVAPVVVIPGNHDLNVRADGAPNLIAPMLEAAGGARELQPPRVTCCNDSTVFTAHGAVWAAAVPGQPMPTAADVAAEIAMAPPGTPLVALIHESVGGAKYPNGVTAKRVPLKTADLAALADTARDRPCAVMLGDIYARQEVPFAGSGVGAAAWYPGSLVCQNLGEHHNGHGYLLWDLGIDGTPGAPSVNVRPRDVENTRAPLTIRLDDTGADVTDPEARPDRPRAYRIVHHPSAPAAAVDAAVKDAKAKYGFAPRSIAVDPSVAVVAAAPAAGPANPALHDAHDDWHRLETAARTILADASTPNDVVDKALAMLHKEVEGTLGGRGAPARAELARLEFDDMYCYGPGNVIDLTRCAPAGPG